MAELAIDCWRTPSSPLDEGLGISGTGRVRPLSLCGLHLASGGQRRSPCPHPVQCLFLPVWSLVLHVENAQDYLF